ncbi:MAG: hypothetical protein ACKVHQ_13605 [Gammaproteobacteria bacterium]
MTTFKFMQVKSVLPQLLKISFFTIFMLVMGITQGQDFKPVTTMTG